MGSSGLFAFGFVFAIAFAAFSRFALGVYFAAVCAVTVVIQVGDPSLFSASSAQGS